MVSKLKEQLEAVRRETSSWPEWRKLEIEAEVLKTPLRSQPGHNPASSQTSGKKGGDDRPSC